MYSKHTSVPLYWLPCLGSIQSKIIKSYDYSWEYHRYLDALLHDQSLQRNRSSIHPQRRPFSPAHRAGGDACYYDMRRTSMKRSTDRIRTMHAGKFLPGPADLRPC